MRNRIILLLLVTQAFFSCQTSEPDLNRVVPYQLLRTQEGVLGTGNNVVANFFLMVSPAIANNENDLLTVANNIRGDRQDPINIYFFTTRVTIGDALANEWLITDPKLSTYVGKVISSYSLSNRKTYLAYVKFNTTQSGTIDII